MQLPRYPLIANPILSAGTALAWKLVVAVACLYVAFGSAFGFLLGQAFFGFSLTDSIAAFAGIVAAVAGIGVNFSSRAARPAFYSAIVSLIGVGADAGAYYLQPHHAGNYYAWELVAPFVIGLGIIGYAGWHAHRRAGG